MTSHCPPATVAAVRRQLEAGVATMLPSPLAIIVAEELQSRFVCDVCVFCLFVCDVCGLFCFVCVEECV